MTGSDSADLTSVGVYCGGVSTPILWAWSSVERLRGVNTHPAFALLICWALGPSPKARPGLTATTSQSWSCCVFLLGETVTRVCLCASASKLDLTRSHPSGIFLCCNREATGGWTKPDVYRLYRRMDPCHPRCLQPIFPIYLTASHRLWCSLLPRRLTMVFMCGPGLSRAVYIHGEAIWAAARRSASAAVSLAAVPLSAGRWQHRAWG